MKVLLVEDDDKLREGLAHLLKESGYVVDTAADGEHGAELAAMEVYDLIVLDRMLPQLDGLTLLKELRERKVVTPVLLLTAMDAPEERVAGLNAGADDYLVKPFFADELLARLRSLSRRSQREWNDGEIVVGDLTLSPLRSEVCKSGKTFRLTTKELLLLELLMLNKGRVVTREAIMARIWGYNTDCDFASIDVYIHFLRRKLDLSTIRTVRGVGYCLEDELHVS